MLTFCPFSFQFQSPQANSLTSQQGGSAGKDVFPPSLTTKAACPGNTRWEEGQLPDLRLPCALRLPAGAEFRPVSLLLDALSLFPLHPALELALSPGLKHSLPCVVHSYTTRLHSQLHCTQGKKCGGSAYSPLTWTPSRGLLHSPGHLGLRWHLLRTPNSRQ